MIGVHSEAVGTRNRRGDLVSIEDNGLMPRSRRRHRAEAAPPSQAERRICTLYRMNFALIPISSEAWRKRLDLYSSFYALRYPDI